MHRQIADPAKMTPNPLFHLPPIPHQQAAALRRFYPPTTSATPADLFVNKINGGSVPAFRLIRKDNKQQMLIFIDGSCVGNGTPSARAGYGVKWSQEHHLSSRLEGDGPETSNRAELRAAIVALEIRAWNREGCDKVLLACDSEYVVLGICERLPLWRQRGWTTSDRRPVANRDLWEKLLARIEYWDNQGVLVQFWRIPRKFNEADGSAMIGALQENREVLMGHIAALDDENTLIFSCY